MSVTISKYVEVDISASDLDATDLATLLSDRMDKRDKTHEVKYFVRSLRFDDNLEPFLDVLRNDFGYTITGGE